MAVTSSVSTSVIGILHPDVMRMIEDSCHRDQDDLNEQGGSEQPQDAQDRKQSGPVNVSLDFLD